MSLFPTHEEAGSPSLPRRRRVGLWVILAVIVVLGMAGAGLYFLADRFGVQNAQSDNKAQTVRSYRTLGRTELRVEASAAARVLVTLREGTTVSGIPAGNKDGTEWLEITAVDGTRGFAPKTFLRELGPAAATTQIAPGTRRLVTSTTVNLRETPSLSGKILGVAEGGTRLVSDGSIQSEGEDWLRIPLDGQTTVFVMQRFTTSDDDAGSAEGVEGEANAALGVRAFATAIVNVQATPLDTGRVIRALQLQEEVRVIGQTNSGRSWYVLRLSDGSQGFAPREAIRIDPGASRWVYPDGTPAPGPNIPKGMTTPVNPGEKSVTTQRRAAGGNDTASQNPTDTVASPDVPAEGSVPEGNETSTADPAAPQAAPAVTPPPEQ